MDYVRQRLTGIVCPKSSYFFDHLITAAAVGAAGRGGKPSKDLDDRIEQLEARLRDAEIEKAVLTRNIHLLQNQLDISGHKTGGPDVQARTDSVCIILG